MSIITSATGEQVLVDTSINSKFGTPPSVNPALYDIKTGQLIPEAVPIKPPMPTWEKMFLVGAGAFIIYHYFIKNK